MNDFHDFKISVLRSNSQDKIKALRIFIFLIFVNMGLFAINLYIFISQGKPWGAAFGVGVATTSMIYLLMEIITYYQSSRIDEQYLRSLIEYADKIELVEAREANEGARMQYENARADYEIRLKKLQESKD
jgi:hypothetical protein